MHEKTYKPYLDGLRGISILLVVIAHGGLGHFVPGGLGVTIFFFISGYLITSLLIKEQVENKSVNLMNFYMRRLWRLLPAMAVYILIAVLLINYLNGFVYWPEPLSAIFYLSNYYIIFGGYNYVGDAYSPLSILWSLAVEEHFYLFFAPLIAFVKNKKSIFFSIIALLLIPLFIRLLMTVFTSTAFSEEYTYRATDARIDSIAYGCLLAVMRDTGFTRFRGYFVVVMGLVGLFFSLIYRDEIFRQTLRYTLQGICLYFIFRELIYTEKMKFLRQTLATPILVYVGKLSYSMYLYHWLALILTVTFFGKIEIKSQWQAIYWGGSLLLSILSYYAIERPTLRLRVKYGSNAT